MPLQDHALPKYTLGEELCNAITHGLGAIFGVICLVLCVVQAVTHGDVFGVVGSAIYGSALIILYANSCIYHSLRPNNGKRVMRIIDHCSIYLLIAGTYTPFTLVSLRQESAGWGWTIFGIVWGAAVLGIIFNAISVERFKVFSMICYIAMGWSIIVAIFPLIRAMSIPALWLLFMGGVAYTLGSVLYGIGKKKKYIHSVFHVFVLLGSVLHFIAIYAYVLPLR